MPNYKAPLREIKFVFNELTPELFDAIVDNASKFAENVVAPLNRSGDEQGLPGSCSAIRSVVGR